MEEFARQRSQNNAQRDLLFHWRCLLPESILALPTSPAPCRVALDSPQVNPLFVGRHIMLTYLLPAAAALHRFAGGLRSTARKDRG